MARIEGLDTDGKKIVKVDPSQVVVGKDGTISINNEDLKKFVTEKKEEIAKDLHLILMGSSCGCQCCC